MRFGMFIPQGWRQDLTGIDARHHWSTMRDLAQHADGGAWESVWVYDHFHSVPEPNGEAVHEAWSLINAFGAVTDRVRLGQMCTCMAYRNPAYLAKVAATADIVSGGRVEMGIGGGWYEHEWRAYGYGFPRIGDRLGALDEGVQIFRQMWGTGTGTLHGKHYEVDGAQLSPLPLQAGGPPIWIAGGGEKVTLRIAAKYGQYTNFGGNPEAFAAKSEILAGHCRDLGRDVDEITRSSSFNVVVAESAKDIPALLDRYEAHYAKTVPASAAAERADLAGGYLVGTAEQIVEKIQHMESLGMGYAICYFPLVAYDRSALELFETEVLKALA